MVGGGTQERGPATDCGEIAPQRCRRRAKTASLAERDQVEASVGLTPSALLASLTHELRTPVAALATGSELLLEDLDHLSHDELRHIVQAVHRGAVWLQGLVENVLFAATLADGAARIYPRPLNLAELIRDIGPVVEPLLRQRSQHLRIVDRGGGELVLADSRRIGQVLINLIGNASKYSGPGTVIDVRVSRTAAGMRLTVADRGSGLPIGRAERLFGAYARGHSSANSRIEGAGLGLAIVRSIAELHGGSVGASRRRGGGSQFWVELPALADAAPETVQGQMAKERLA